MAVPEGAIRVAAPAKINLYLHVTGRRDDGYHLLDSLVAFAAIHDTLVIRPADALTLALDGPFAAALAGAGDAGDNLVLRAGRHLAEAYGVAKGADILLVKRLPVASGIGGGSADAAAALKGLCALWQIDPGTAAIERIGAALGADVPVCLHGAPSFVSGIGEILAPALLPAGVPVVLVNPGRPVATGPVFAARAGAFSAPAPRAADLADAVALARFLAASRNDLAPPAMAIEPAIGDVLAALEDEPDCLLARLSGSGATCFGLFASREAAGAAARHIADARPGWWVAPTRLLAAGESLEAD